MCMFEFLLIAQAFSLGDIAFAKKRDAEFTPLSRGSALVAWYKADVGVYEDAGTDTAEDGEGVQQWNDQSGNNRHIVQATAADRPLFQTGMQNSLPGIEFVSSDWLALGAAVATAAPFTIYAAARTSGTAYQSVVCLCASSVNEYFELEFTSSGISRVAFELRDVAGDTPLNSSTSYTLDTVHTLSAKETSNVSHSVWIDGGSGVTNATDRIPASINEFSVGMRRSATPGFPLTGFVMEIIVTNQADSDAQRAAMENYLATKWAL